MRNENRERHELSNQEFEREQSFRNRDSILRGKSRRGETRLLSFEGVLVDAEVIFALAKVSGGVCQIAGGDVEIAF